VHGTLLLLLAVVAFAHSALHLQLSLSNQSGLQPPGSGGIYDDDEVKVPRAAACLDLVRTTCVFDDPMAMVEAFGDLDAALVRIHREFVYYNCSPRQSLRVVFFTKAKVKGVSPIIEVHNSYAKGFNTAYIMQS